MEKKKRGGEGEFKQILNMLFTSNTFFTPIKLTVNTKSKRQNTTPVLLARYRCTITTAN